MACKRKWSWDLCSVFRNGRIQKPRREEKGKGPPRHPSPHGCSCPVNLSELRQRRGANRIRPTADGAGLAGQANRTPGVLSGTTRLRANLSVFVRPAGGHHRTGTRKPKVAWSKFSHLSRARLQLAEFMRLGLVLALHTA